MRHLEVTVLKTKCAKAQKQNDNAEKVKCGINWRRTWREKKIKSSCLFTVVGHEYKKDIKDQRILMEKKMVNGPAGICRKDIARA